MISSGRHEIQSKDNVKVTIETSAAYRVTNPVLVHYRLGNNLKRSIL